MKHLSLLLFCGMAASAFSQPPSDLIITKSGDEIVCRLLRVEGGRVRFEMKLGNGRAESVLPLDLIQKYLPAQRFDPASLPDDPTARARVLTEQWQIRQPFLSIPESDAGEVALQLVAALCSTQRWDAALDLAREIGRSDWDLRRRMRATATEVQALAGLGRLDEALTLAKRVQESAKESSSEAFVRLLVGEMELSQKKYAAAADQFFYTRLFYPHLREEAAEALWGASRAFLAQGNLLQAGRALEDLLADYPGTRPCTQAHAELQKIRPEMDRLQKNLEPKEEI